MENGWSATARYFHDYLISSGKAENTAKTYVANLRIFWQACARYECTPYEADRNICRGFISDRLGVASSTRVNSELSALKHFYAYLYETRYREDDPIKGLKVKRQKGLPTKPLYQNEIEQLLAACGNERDRLIILMLGTTATRISELAGITAEDIDWQTGLLTIRGKGGKERLVAPRKDVLNRLLAYLGMFPSGPIWLSKVQQRPMSAHQIRKIIYEIASKAKIEDVHPHRLRAAFATAFIDQFGDIQALQSIMGHESITTTARYSEWTRERRAMTQMRALEIMGPVA